METKKFNVKKYGKYFNLNYITNLDGKLNFTHKFKASRLLSSKDDVTKFIETAIEFENHIKNILSEKEFDYDYALIMLNSMAVIDNISCGLDVRAKYPRKDIAENFVMHYHKQFNEAKQICNETFNFVVTNGLTTSYMKDWKRYDKYNEFNKEYLFGMPEITTESFGNDELTKMLELTGDILDYFKKQKN